MNAKKPSAIESILSAARLNNTVIETIPFELNPKNEDEAYMAQNRLKNILVSNNYGTISGNKIGCTTRVMQKYLVIQNPCAGGIFKKNTHYNSASVQFDQYIRPGVECEIAVRIGKDMDDSYIKYDHNSVSRSIDSVMASIEIVDDRWQNFNLVETPSLIADDFFGSGCVLGKPEKWKQQDLRLINGHMSINGTIVGDGNGGDIMGNPLKALAWLANMKSKRDDHLKAGDFVTLGSIVQTIWVNRGDEVKINMGTLGFAKVNFE